MAAVEAPLVELPDLVQDTSDVESLSPSHGSLDDTSSINCLGVPYVSKQLSWTDVVPPADDLWREPWLSVEEDRVYMNRASPQHTAKSSYRFSGCQAISEQENEAVRFKRVNLSLQDATFSDIWTNRHSSRHQQRKSRQNSAPPSWMNFLGAGARIDETGPPVWVESNKSRPPKRRGSTERRYELLSDNDDEDDEDTGRNRPRKATSARQEGTRHTWACPYAKYDTVKYFSCVTFKLLRIVDVRQHLRRKHMAAKYHCPTCGNEFSTIEAMDIHVRDRSCAFVSFHSEGVSDDQWQAISSAAGKRDSEADRWYEIWDILFPLLPRPASPFANGLYTEALQQGLKSYLRGEGQNIVFNTLDSNFPDGDLSTRVTQLERLAVSVTDDLILGLTTRMGDAWDTNAPSLVANPLDKVESRLPINTSGALRPLFLQRSEPWMVNELHVQHENLQHRSSSSELVDVPSRSPAPGGQGAEHLHIPNRTSEHHQTLMVDLRPPRLELCSDEPSENMTENTGFSMAPSLPTEYDFEEQIGNGVRPLPAALTTKQSEQSDLNVHTCSECGRDFVNRRDLRRHTFTVHSKKDMELFHCTCGLTTARKDNFRRHVRVCLKIRKQVQPYRCSCKQEFTDLEEIIHHISTCGRGRLRRLRQVTGLETQTVADEATEEVGC